MLFVICQLWFGGFGASSECSREGAAIRGGLESPLLLPHCDLRGKAGRNFGNFSERGVRSGVERLLGRLAGAGLGGDTWCGDIRGPNCAMQPLLQISIRFLRQAAQAISRLEVDTHDTVASLRMPIGFEQSTTPCTAYDAGRAMGRWKTRYLLVADCPCQHVA